MIERTVVVIDKQRLDESLPAIVAITPDGHRYGDEVIIRDELGVEVVRVTGIAMGKEPVGGARIWLETMMPVTIVRHDKLQKAVK